MIVETIDAKSSSLKLTKRLDTGMIRTAESAIMFESNGARSQFVLA